MKIIPYKEPGSNPLPLHRTLHIKTMQLCRIRAIPVASNTSNYPLSIGRISGPAVLTGDLQKQFEWNLIQHPAAQGVQQVTIGLGFPLSLLLEGDPEQIRALVSLDKLPDSLGMLSETFGSLPAETKEKISAIFQRGRISCRAEKLKKGGISNFVNNGSGCSSNSYSICLHRSTE